MSLNEISIETIDLDSSSMKPIKLSSNDADISSSIPGIEMLMNKKSSLSSKNKTNSNDLDSIENELNELSGVSIGGLASDKLNSNTLGKSVANDFKFDSEKKQSTWDGFGRINNSETEIPLNPSIKITGDSKKGKGDVLKEKFNYLRRLEELEKKGVRLSQKYNHDSSLNDIKSEYEAHVEEREKRNSINFQGRMMQATVTGLEFLNSKFDPFDIKLDGWADQVTESIDDYNDIFEELHEKYKTKAKMAPELKLLFQLGGSAIMLHMTNTMFKTSLPGMEDIMRQNPELMEQFTKAAVNKMSQENPGFGSFMGDVSENHERTSRTRGPPPPVETQGSNAAEPPRRSNGGQSGRPDIGFARSGDLDGDGISLSDNLVDVNTVERTTRKRPEMKGPRDISSLLGKTSSPVSIQQANKIEVVSDKPSRTKRRGRGSPKTTMSLDL